jgi:hypothetical protein
MPMPNRLDVADLEQLLAERGEQLMRAAIALTGSRQAGEDLLQAALERVLATPRRAVADTEGYLRRTLYNLAADGWRRRDRWRARVPLLDASASRADDDVTGDFTWLKATSAHLAAFDVPIPPGFRQVRSGPLPQFGFGSFTSWVPAPSPSLAPSPSPSLSPVPSGSAAPMPTASPSGSPTPSAPVPSPSGSPTPTPSRSSSPGPSPTPSPTPVHSGSPIPVPSPSGS